MKGIVQILTVLPAARQGEACWNLNFKPNELETIQTQPFSSWFYETWGATHGCNDMLWSGHTSQSCLGLLFIEKNLRHMGVPLIIRLLLFAYFAVYVWAVLACRMHYSIDVFVATLVAMALFTHVGLRFGIWSFANHVVCNEPFEKEEEEEEEVETTDDDEEHR